MLGLMFFAVLTWVYAWMGRGPADLATVWPLACISALQFAILWRPIHIGVAGVRVRKLMSCVFALAGLGAMAYVLWFVSPGAAPLL